MHAQIIVHPASFEATLFHFCTSHFPEKILRSYIYSGQKKSPYSNALTSGEARLLQLFIAIFLRMMWLSRGECGWAAVFSPATNGLSMDSKPNRSSVFML